MDVDNDGQARNYGNATGRERASFLLDAFFAKYDTNSPANLCLCSDLVVEPTEFARTDHVHDDRALPQFRPNSIAPIPPKLTCFTNEDRLLCERPKRAPI